MRLDRRRFLQEMLAASAIAGLPSQPARALEVPIAFQLHAVRGLAAKDFPGTLRAIGRLGYDEVELVSFPGYASPAPRDGFAALAPMSPRAVRDTIEDAGLTVTSAHFKYEQFDDTRIRNSVEWAHGVGLQYMTVADLPAASTLDEWKRHTDSLNTLGERVRNEGMRLALHTQNDFWRAIEGSTVMDAMLAGLGAANCRIQLDLSTTQAMGVDAAAFLRRHGSRCFSVHLRDAPTPSPMGGYVYSVALGEGDLDLEEIFDAAGAARIDKYIVEMQVQPPGDPVEALRRSAQFVRELRPRMPQ